MKDSEGFVFGVVVLAAGASSRMGRPKGLLPWGGTTVLGHILAEWRRVGAAQAGVVVSALGPKISEEVQQLGLDFADCIENPEPEGGMFSSVRTAALWPGWNPGLSHFAIALGDQPHLRRTTLAAVLEQARREPDRIWQPSLGGLARHPMVLPAWLFLALGPVPAGTLRDFLKEYRGLRSLLEIDDPGLGLDIDTPADYDQARRLAGLNGWSRGGRLEG